MGSKTMILFGCVVEILVSGVVCVLIRMIVDIDIGMHDMHVFQVKFVLHR
jgi:hypothetical protein